MSVAVPSFDPLIAEAKVRMRRRRVLLAMLALIAVACVLTLILRPSGTPGTSRATAHGGKGNALAHIKVPVDASERTWRAGITKMIRNAQTASGITVAGERRLDRKVTHVADRTGATIVRIKIWPPYGDVDLVLATRTNPAEYLAHRLPRIVHLLDHGTPYVKVVNGKGSSIFEWYYLPGSGSVGVPKPLQMCSPVMAVTWIDNPPPCPVK